MSNNIIFLGTAGDSQVSGKQVRASGGIIIQIGELQFHLNPGPGSLVRAAQYGVNLRANTAIFVTNSNLLNCNDVNAVIDAMTYGGMDKNGLLVANKTVVQGDEKHSPFLNRSQASCVERIIMLTKGQKMAIEEVEIHALPAETTDENAIGLKFLAPDFTLVYSSDTKYSKDIVEQYKGADILLLNVNLPGNERSDESLSSDDAKKIIKEVNPKLAILTNFGMKMIKADPLYEGRMIQKDTDIQVIVAKDGMTISPGSYAANSNQKRLNTYKFEKAGAVKVSEPEGEAKDTENNPAEDAGFSEESKEYHQEHLKF